MKYNDFTQQKAEIRAKLKQIRASIPKHDRLTHSKIITQKNLELDEIKAALHIFIYISYASEVDTHELINTLLEQGKMLAVPKIINAETMIATAFTDWETLIPDNLGILTPANVTPYPEPIDIVVTPGLGFTPAGYRIGYGRGYYDNWFAEHPVKHKIALAFEAQILDELPINEFDIPVDKIITEDQIINIQHL